MTAAVEERREQALCTAGFTLLLASIVLLFVDSVATSVLLTGVLGACMVGGLVLAGRGESFATRYRSTSTRSKVSSFTVLAAALLLVATIPLGMQSIYDVLAGVSVAGMLVLGSSLRHDERERRRQAH